MHSIHRNFHVRKRVTNEIGDYGNFRETRESERGASLIRLAHLDSTGDLSQLPIEIYMLRRP